MKTSILAMTAAMAATAVAAQDIPQAENAWFVAAQERIQDELAKQRNTNRATNVILLIADGNGVGTNYATRLFMGQQEGGYGDDHVMHYETFPSLALVKTYNTNSQTPDSAGTGTAMLSGVKTKIGVLGVDEDVVRGDCSTLPGNEVATAGEIFTEMGKEVGVVSTARITHATPAAVYAHSVDRNFGATVPEGCTEQKDIAMQLMDAMEAGTVDFAMGGGRRNFITTEMTDDEGDNGRREDGQNLIEMAGERGYAYAWNAETAAELPTDGSTPILGLFEDSHMAYEADRSDEPSLTEMTEIALKNLQAKSGEDGYFLMVEAGRVDHAQHATNLARTVRDGAEFTRMIERVDELTNDADTLIVVTADHEHSMALNGYCGRGSPILGLCMEPDPAGEAHTGEPVMANDGKPFTVAMYTNGASSIVVQAEGANGEFVVDRPDVTNEEAQDIDYTQQALVPKDSESHSAEDVAVYAKGPWAHLFDGTIEQNYVFHVMHHAATAE